MKSILFFCLTLFLSTNLIAEPEIKIGAVLPLTGDAQIFGREAQLALEHAMADTPKKKFKYKLILEDDQFSSAKASLGAKKLLEIDQAKIIFSNWSYGGNSVASTVTNKDAINLTFGWDRSILDAGQNNYLIASPPEELARILVDKIKAEGKESIVLLGFQEAGVDFAFNAIELEAKKAGIKVLKRAETRPTDTAVYRSILLQVKELSPDYLVTCLIYPQILELFKQMKVFKIDLPIAYIGQAPHGPGLKQLLPKVWWSVDYQISPERQEAVRVRTGLQDFSGYPGYYEALRAIISIYESAPSAEIPSIPWVQEQLNAYQRSESYLGKIYFKDRHFISENAFVTDQLTRY